MASNRDVLTRSVRKYERQTGTTVPVSYSGYGNNKREASTRNKGRRGVRARKRNDRILKRMANGTYTQPSGGTVTNS